MDLAARPQLLQSPDVILNPYRFASASTLLNDLVAWWPLTETSGTRYDSHTNGLDLTDNSSVGYSTVNGANGADFATTNYLSHADDALLDFSTQLSIAFWANPDVWTSYRCITQKGTWASIAYSVYTVADGVNRLRTLFNKTTATADTPNSSSWTNSDKHIVITYNGGGSTNADKVKIYINGASQTLVFTGTIDASISDRSGDYRIGGANGTLSNFDGGIAEMALWSRALTSNEVTELYDGGNRLTYADL